MLLIHEKSGHDYAYATTDELAWCVYARGLNASINSYSERNELKKEFWSHNRFVKWAPGPWPSAMVIDYS